jgi:hypothetical protein
MGAVNKKKQTKKAKLAKLYPDGQFQFEPEYCASVASGDEDDKIAEVMTAVENELRSAVKAHGPMKSMHEGYAVILEEMDELWEHVRLKEKLRKKKDMREEAIQIAAMAVRFVIDLL